MATAPSLPLSLGPESSPSTHHPAQPQDHVHCASLRMVKKQGQPTGWEMGTGIGAPVRHVSPAAAGDLLAQQCRGGARSGLRAQSLGSKGPGRQADPGREQAGSRHQAPVRMPSPLQRIEQGAPPSPAGTCREGAALGWWGPREGVGPPSRLCQVPPTGCSPQRGPRGFPLRHPSPMPGVPSPAELGSGLGPSSCGSLAHWDRKDVLCLQVGV